MDEQRVGTLTFAGYTANIFSTNTPGEFRIVYNNDSGEILEEVPLTGISTYHQREAEIMERLQQLHDGSTSPAPYLADAGEY